MQLTEITLKELQVQIGLGLIPTESKIATIVKRTQNINILKWALKHRSVKIRAAAIENINLPIGYFIHSGLFAITAGERIAYTKVLDERTVEMKQVLKVIAEYPQLSLIFNDEVTTEHK